MKRIGRTRAERILLTLYLAALALLPWSWFPPFPWLHEHAQWSDPLIAASVAVWAVERRLAGGRFKLRPAHVAMGLYLAAATLSLLVAAPDKRAGSLKLLGMLELVLLAALTSDLASRPGVLRLITRVVAATSLAAAAAAALGIVLFYVGAETRLIGTYGDLTPSRWYARAQAGLYHPNLLASYCIFAAAVVARGRRELPPWLRRVAPAALWVAVLLTFSRAILGFGLAAMVRGAVTGKGRALTAIYAAASLAVVIALSTWNLSFDPSRPFAATITSDVPPSRWQTMTSAARTLAVNPIWGSGPGTVPGWYRDTPYDAHCTPLNIAATLGLPALAAFIAIFAALWQGRSRPTDLAIWGGLAGLALDALASDIEDYRHLWVLSGLADADSAGAKK